MISGAELTIYSIQGDEVSMSLSGVQLQAVCKMLGLKYDGAANFICYSDDGLKTIMDRTINRLKEI